MNQKNSLEEITLTDIPFMIKGFSETHAGISHADAESYEQRIRKDILSSAPKAYAKTFIIDGNKIGYVVYAHGYFMSTGSVLWVSQLYIDPKYRGRYLHTIIKLIKQMAHDIGAVRLVWCSEIHNQRLSKLWSFGHAKNLNESFSFWAIKTDD